MMCIAVSDQRSAISDQLSAPSRRLWRRCDGEAVGLDIVAPSPPRPLAPARLSSPQASRTSGATLLEVLMAMVVMAIGVLTVATLFPISVLRAVQATKLTNATIMRFNAESAIRIQPNLILDPDNDGDLAEHSDPLNANYRPHYLVDPLGYEIHERDLNVGYEDDFGAQGILPRYEYDRTTEPTAEALVADPDSWNSQADGLVTNSAAPPDIQLTNNLDLSGVNFAGPPGGLVSRAILVDQTGRSSVTRNITNINTATDPDTITLESAWPAGFTPVTARVETHEPRNFSWMLSVRNEGVSGVFVDVIVFFRRPFGTDDETIFNMTRQTGNSYQVAYAPGAQKFWKRGGYLFDVDACRWYRIQRVEPGNNRDLLTLERSPGAVITRAAFMRNIVDVYALGDMR
ncbi:MAG: hypothetical protein WD648_11240 [Planctomycetaceae bacterium]